MLQMNPEKVCFVIVKAREFDVAEAVVVEDEGSNPSDEKLGDLDVLQGAPEDPAYLELKEFIDALNEDEQAELVALVWLGRADYTTDEWSEALEAARDRHTGSTSEYLLGIPVLADYLEEGLAQFDLSCESFERGHL